MITRIEIDGFKTFKDFTVELAPFQVIVGPNGSGKSNLFDALHLLSRLAEYDVQTAFQDLRGDASDQFTKYADGRRSEKIRIAVEMLLNRTVQNKNGGDVVEIGDGKFVPLREVALQYTRLRYELEITFRQEETYVSQPFQITHESLKSITSEDTWSKKYIPSSNNTFLQGTLEKQSVFIDTEWRPVAVVQLRDGTETEVQNQIIFLYPDGDKHGKVKRFYAEELQRSTLNRTNDIIYPHVLAVREELQSLKFFHLNADALHQPSAINATSFLKTDGSNLPTTLARIQAEDESSFYMISLDMASLVSSIIDIEVFRDVALNKYLIRARTSDQRSFFADVLSDGTLRLLAFATLRNDTRSTGILCIEEPENGVEPLYLNKIARLLKEMVTNFHEPQQSEPLRQVICTTHSSLFVSQPEVIDSLLFTFVPTQAQGKNTPALRITRMAPVETPDTLVAKDEKRPVEAFTIDMIRKYLDSDTLNDASNKLQRAITLLHEGS